MGHVSLVQKSRLIISVMSDACLCYDDAACEKVFTVNRFGLKHLLNGQIVSRKILVFAVFCLVERMACKIACVSLGTLIGYSESIALSTGKKILGLQRHLMNN